MNIIIKEKTLIIEDSSGEKVELDEREVKQLYGVIGVEYYGVQED